MNATEIQTFISAGRAVFTLQSAATGVHFTYRVTAPEPAPGMTPPLFASVLVAPDTYAYIGMIRNGQLHLTAKSKCGAGALSFKALDWFLRQLARGVVPAAAVFRHEGRCGRCARALTTPASVDTGLGPDCAAILGVPHEARPAAAPDPTLDGALAKAHPHLFPSESGRSLQQVLAERRAAYGGTGYSAGQD